MIEAYESGTAPAFELYGLGLEHKHVPELQLYSGLTRRPIFVPSVGNFHQGMLISIPLHLDTLPGKPIAARSRGGCSCATMPAAGSSKSSPRPTIGQGGRLEPEALNGTNQLELRVFGTSEARRRPCWWRGSTTSARGRPAPRCRTSA